MNILDKLERWMELLGDAGDHLKNELTENAVDQLDGKAVTPLPGVAIAAGKVKFVFDDMASIYAGRVEQLEDFIRRTGVADEAPATSEPLELVYEEEGTTDK